MHEQGEKIDLQKQQLRIVVVEDNADSREMIQLLLELDGYSVITCEDGAEGLRAILAHRPDVALVDIGLPTMSGYEIASRVRQQLCQETTLLVAVTGYGSPESRRASRIAGFDEHLVKPLPVDHLQRILAERRSL